MEVVIDKRKTTAATILWLSTQYSTRSFNYYRYGIKHRRRINTEEKTKVIAAVGWTELIQFLAEQDDLK